MYSHQIHICSLFRFSILYYNNVVGGRCWYFKVKLIKVHLIYRR